jgi:hypothetical protein
VPEPPVIVEGTRVADGLLEVELNARVKPTLLLKPKIGVTVMVEVPEAPPTMTDTDVGSAEIVKVGRLMKVPVCAVSTLGAAPPLVIVTQVFGTLEPLGQLPEVVAEVRKLTGVPVVPATTW